MFKAVNIIFSLVILFTTPLAWGSSCQQLFSDDDLRSLLLNKALTPEAVENLEGWLQNTDTDIRSAFLSQITQDAIEHLGASEDAAYLSPNFIVKVLTVKAIGRGIWSDTVEKLVRVIRKHYPNLYIDNPNATKIYLVSLYNGDVIGAKININEGSKIFTSLFDHEFNKLGDWEPRGLANSRY